MSKLKTRIKTGIFSFAFIMKKKDRRRTRTPDAIMKFYFLVLKTIFESPSILFNLFHQTYKCLK
jgi:hypothetical protein